MATKKSWEDLYDEGRLFIYSDINDHDGELTVSAHLAPDLDDPADVNDPEVFSASPANQLVEDGFLEGNIGSDLFKFSVASYMDHLGIKRPRAKRSG